MNKLLNLFFSVFIFIAIVFNAQAVYAKADVLSKVTVSDSPNGGYNVVLETNKPAKYSVKKISANKIILNIKNTVASNEVSTTYNNATNLEHVIINPVFGGTLIEISGENASKSNISLTGGVQKSAGSFWQIILLIPLASILLFKKRQHKEFSTKISITDEENKILKVEFERKRGLIAKGTGARRVPTQTENVRKVVFADEPTTRELNIR